MKKIISFAMTLLLTAAAIAQSNTGRLIGTVSGPDGVLPGATVKVTDNQTGKERTITSNGEGAFLLPQLDPGTYDVNVTVNGFKTFNANNVKIDIGQEYSLNVGLEIGQTAARNLGRRTACSHCSAASLAPAHKPSMRRRARPGTRPARLIMRSMYIRSI